MYRNDAPEEIDLYRSEDGRPESTSYMQAVAVTGYKEAFYSLEKLPCVNPLPLHPFNSRAQCFQTPINLFIAPVDLMDVVDDAFAFG